MPEYTMETHSALGFLARFQFVVVGKEIDDTSGPILAIDIGTVTASAFFTHIFAVLLAQVCRVAVRMPVTSRCLRLWLFVGHVPMPKYNRLLWNVSLSPHLEVMKWDQDLDGFSNAFHASLTFQSAQVQISDIT